MIKIKNLLLTASLVCGFTSIGQASQKENEENNPYMNYSGPAFVNQTEECFAVDEARKHILELMACVDKEIIEPPRDVWSFYHYHRNIPQSDNDNLPVKKGFEITDFNANPHKVRGKYFFIRSSIPSRGLLFGELSNELKVLIFSLTSPKTLANLKLVSKSINALVMEHHDILWKNPNLWQNFGLSIWQRSSAEFRGLNVLPKLKPYFDYIQHLKVEDFKNMTEESYNFLSSSTQLQSLYIKDCNMTDKSIFFLTSLTNLTKLEIILSKVQNLEPLKQLTNLTSLKLQGLKLNDDPLHNITGLTNLQNLNLSINNITSEGGKTLTSLKNLRKLKMTMNKLDLSTIQIWTVLQQLTEVYVWCNKVTFRQSNNPFGPQIKFHGDIMF